MHEWVGCVISITTQTSFAIVPTHTQSEVDSNAHRQSEAYSEANPRLKVERMDKNINGNIDHKTDAHKQKFDSSSVGSSFCEQIVLASARSNQPTKMSMLTMTQNKHTQAILTVQL